jgi:hypothetical protein
VLISAILANGMKVIDNVIGIVVVNIYHIHDCFMGRRRLRLDPFQYVISIVMFGEMNLVFQLKYRLLVNCVEAFLQI